MRPTELVAALVLLGAVPLTAQDQATVRATATIRIPDLLTFRVVDEAVEGELQPVVLVSANQRWRLTVRVAGEEAVLEGDPGRDQRRRIPQRLLARRHRPNEPPARLELTLEPLR